MKSPGFLLPMFASLLAAACVDSRGAAPVPALNAEPPNARTQTPAFPGQTRAPERRSSVAFTVQTVATGLENPWAIEVLPSGRMLVTERPGRLRVVAADGALSPPVSGVPAVDARAQGGLLDVAVDPGFAQNGLVYLSFAERRDDGSNHTAVLRARLVDDAEPRLEDAAVIYRQQPSMKSTGHYGSRLAFRGDGTLFVTQGDRQVAEGRALVQQPDNLVGKIVRINSDGSIPQDNPFVGTPGHRPETWSLGHRNSQAAAIHPESGELWEIEHGTHGGDELNVARKGRNYGWPVIAYGVEYSGTAIGAGLTAQQGLEQPAYYWDPVIAPSGMLFYSGTLFPAWRGSLFVGGLGSTSLVRLELDGERVTGEERLLTDLEPKPERIRDVTEGPDGALYLVTDETKGRVLRLVPKN